LRKESCVEEAYVKEACHETRRPAVPDHSGAPPHPEAADGGRDRELETSKRTVYRDIATLIGQRVPIRGEAGMGYILEKGFDLPPLMLTPDEIEAAVLGAQWVSGHADEALARAAQDLIAKIADTVPEHLRPFVLEPASRARPDWRREPDRIDMARTRTQIHQGKKNHAALP
jgi:predicted DNA-binding transcriptional regulator YafY